MASRVALFPAPDEKRPARNSGNVADCLGFFLSAGGGVWVGLAVEEKGGGGGGKRWTTSENETEKTSRRAKGTSHRVYPGRLRKKPSDAIRASRAVARTAARAPYESSSPVLGESIATVRQPWHTTCHGNTTANLLTVRLYAAPLPALANII